MKKEISIGHQKFPDNGICSAMEQVVLGRDSWWKNLNRGWMAICWGCHTGSPQLMTKHLMTIWRYGRSKKGIYDQIQSTKGHLSAVTWLHFIQLPCIYNCLQCPVNMWPQFMTFFFHFYFWLPAKKHPLQTMDSLKEKKRYNQACHMMTCLMTCMTYGCNSGLNYSHKSRTICSTGFLHWTRD